MSVIIPYTSAETPVQVWWCWSVC